MTIDPRVGFWLSIALSAMAFVAGAGATLTDLFGPNSTKIILGICTLILGIGNAINAVLHAIPSQSGPSAAKDFYLGPKPPQT